MRYVISAATVLTVALLSACQDPNALHPSFGNAVRHNMAMHIINPEPLPSDTPVSGVMGTRVKGGIDRYERGEVIEAEAIDTSDVGN